jgi:fumarylacetoacetase
VAAIRGRGVDTVSAAGIDATHDPALQSWVGSANGPGADFPIQNLPFGRFRAASDMDWRIGIAIGDQVLDLQRAGLIETHDMKQLLRLRPEARASLRLAISEGLRAGSDKEALLREALVAQSQVELGLPCEIGDYTDFYIGIHHATAVGKLFRPDNPLLPNYKWVQSELAGHRRSRGAHQFVRRRAGSGRTRTPLPGATTAGFRAQLGVFMAARPQGSPIAIDGRDLSSAWHLQRRSARDIQA